MDGQRFDELTKGLAAGIPRRRVVKGLAGGLVAGAAALLGRSGTDAQRATQASCGNVVCADDPGICNDGCVCCVFGNGNSRCMPPRSCRQSQGEATCPEGEIADPQAGCVCPRQQNGDFCESNEDCCSGICQGYMCVATVAGTCETGQDLCAGESDAFCGNQDCGCFQTVQGDTVCGQAVACGEECNDCESGGFQCGVSGPNCCDGTIPCIAPCPPNACFIGATRITLADGASKPIEQIAAGDRVLGQSGINTVLAVLTPRLGSRRLYALNGSDFFVTASHPFLTDEGWKSIEPAATAVEHAGLAVGRLAVGDRLFALIGVATPAFARAGGTGLGEKLVETRLEAVPLHSIVGIPGDTATPLYNLRVDGDHTYFANDLLVHNKV